MADWKETKAVLDYPIRASADLTITELTFREPDAEALELIGETDLAPGVDPSIKQMVGVAAALAIPEDREWVRRMHYRDLIRAWKESIAPLFQSSLPDGEDQSPPSTA